MEIEESEPESDISEDESVEEFLDDSETEDTVRYKVHDLYKYIYN